VGHTADLLKLAVGAPNNWDTCIPEVGQRAGIFAKHGLQLEILYTQGGGETMQAVISGSVDIGVAAGTQAVMGAYAKGAPVRIVAAEATGAADYFYAKTDSGITSLKDPKAKGKTIAYSTNGSSTDSMVKAFLKEWKVDLKPVATGSPPATLTAVMSNQVDVGWAAPPFGLKEIDEGKILLVARGSDTETIRGQTIRTIIANTDTLKKRRDVLRRFMQAYRETIEYMYSDNPQVMKDYAEFAGITPELAKRVRDEFFPRAILQMTEIKGLDQLLQDAIELKYTDRLLTKEQVAELIQTEIAK